MSGAGRSGSLGASRTSSFNGSLGSGRTSSFVPNTLKRRTVIRRASISTADAASYRENAKKRAEEKRQAELERRKRIRQRNAKKRTLEFDPSTLRCTGKPPTPPRAGKTKGKGESTHSRSVVTAACILEYSARPVSSVAHIWCCVSRDICPYMVLGVT
eukprot:sb/3473028/